ncbi:MAG: hypothetical protein ACYCY6_01785 [Minisyncoccota bacterium]
MSVRTESKKDVVEVVGDMSSYRAYAMLARSLEEAKESIGERRLSKVNPAYVSQLDSLIVALREEAEADFEEDCPK